VSARARAALPPAAVLALCAAAAAAPAAAARGKAARPAPVVVAQVPAAGGALAPAGAPLPVAAEGGRLVLVSPGGGVRVLTAGFHSAADPEVSFDGERILFAARKEAGDPWCVWEMRADGQEARKITCGAAGARQPVYQSTVYTITETSVEPWVQVAFVGEGPGEGNEAGTGPRTSLWSCRTDGTALRRLTHNLSNDADPVVLPDGRMVYAAWLRQPAARAPRVALVGVNLDGTDYQVYAGEGGAPVKRMPVPTADGLVVFVESDDPAGDGSGRLATVSQRRPLHTRRALTGPADGLYRSPAPLPDRRLLVAWRPGPGEGTYGVYRLDPATGARERVLDDPAWHEVAARALAPRAVPDARSSVVREDDPAGKLYAVDVNIHDLGKDLPRGEAKRLRVVEGVPASASRPASRRLLGTIPLAGDGSFQVQVPSNTPIQLQLLDASGLALRASAWIWVRPHAAQGCVGCHEDPERTPPNRFVEALGAPAPVLDLPEALRRTAGYAEEVRPVVEAKCLSCHGGGDAPRLDTTPLGLAAWAGAGEARRSRLLWHLLGRNAARPWDPESGQAAPRPVPEGTLTPDEVRAFVEWIDLGGQP
jgi:hypothetical protein